MKTVAVGWISFQLSLKNNIMDIAGYILMTRLGIIEEKHFGSFSTTNTVHMQTKLIHVIL